MTEQEFACIRALVNFARIAGERTTKASLRSRMLADGWTDDEIKRAIASLRSDEKPLGADELPFEGAPA